MCNLKLTLTCCSSSSRYFKCSKQWPWWHHKEIREETTLSRWQCFNKCNKWSQWCKIWWISKHNRLLKFLNKLSKNNLRNSQTLQTICFLIYSKVQRQVASRHILLIIIWVCLVSANLLQLSSHPCFQGLEPNLHSHRVIQITRLICSIDKKSFISVYILLFKIVNTIYIYFTCLINRV
jgi:hypothetical protein